MDAYHPSSLEGQLTTEETEQVISLYGERDEYEVLPDFKFKSSLHLYPQVESFKTKIELDENPKVKAALLKYAENTESFRLNLCLNLLNKVSNPQLFNNLQMGCLGVHQESLPDVVYRKCKLNEKELEEMRENVGNMYLAKSFISTSVVPQNQFDGVLFRIKLERGKRNGAIDLRKLNTRFNEQEILLCAYSMFRIDAFSAKLIDLTYMDYYQFEFWQDDPFLAYCGYGSVAGGANVAPGVNVAPAASVGCGGSGGCGGSYERDDPFLAAYLY